MTNSGHTVKPSKRKNIRSRASLISKLRRGKQSEHLWKCLSKPVVCTVDVHRSPSRILAWPREQRFKITHGLADCPTTQAYKMCGLNSERWIRMDQCSAALRFQGCRKDVPSVEYAPVLALQCCYNCANAHSKVRHKIQVELRHSGIRQGPPAELP